MSDKSDQDGEKKRRSGLTSALLAGSNAEIRRAVRERVGVLAAGEHKKDLELPEAESVKAAGQKE